MAGSDMDDEGDGLQMYLDDLKREMRKLKKKILELAKASSDDRDKKTKEAEKILGTTEEAMNLFQSSLNQADRESRAMYERDFTKIQKNFNKYKKELDSVRGNKSSSSSHKSKRDELLSETRDEKEEKKKKKKKRRGDDDDGEEDQGRMKQKSKQDKYTKEVTDLQEDNISRLEGMVEIADDTLRIGTAAAAKLKQQRERLTLIQNEVDEIGVGLKRAQAEMRSLYRNLVCSKVIILVVIVILLFAVVAIILRSILEAFGIKVIDENAIFDKIKKKIIKK
jgi:chromosome segregation ATPase